MVTHSYMFEQPEGGAAGAAGGDDVVWVSPHRAALPLTAAILSHSHHLALSVLYIHRALHSVPKQ